MNELTFILHSIFISSSVLFALYLGKEALIAFICLQGVLANLFVTKQITLLSLTATGADAFMIGSILGMNLLQEYFGPAYTKKAIGISFFALIFYTIASQIHLIYIPSLYDFAHPHFSALLGFMPRITIASLVVYVTVLFIERWLYGILKTAFNSKYLVLRNCISVGITQLIDTVLFSFLGLYGIVGNIGHIIIISYCIKIASLLLSTPFLALSHRFAPKK